MDGRVELGDLAKDKVSGFEGIVVADTLWLHGCRRLTIQPNKCDKDGNPIQPVGFDEPQVQLVKSLKHQAVRKTGGPRPEVTRR